MEKLKQLPVYWQLLILLVVATLLFLGFRYTVTGAIYDEAKQVNDQTDALRRKNEQARIATQRIEEFRALYVAKAAEYEELKVLLPEQREITNVLQGLQDTARSSSLTMLRFSPRDDQQQGFITAKPVEVEISCNFNNLREFYEKMAKLPRIVSITDFKINQVQKQIANKTINSQFLLTAYYASPEPLPTAQPGAPGASSTAPTGTAAPKAAAAPGAPSVPAK